MTSRLLRLTFSQPRTRVLTRLTAHRAFHRTSVAFTSTGYGDPPDEKANNQTPTPSSTPDPKPDGKSKATTDPEVSGKSKGKQGDGEGPKAQTGGVGSGGGKQGTGSKDEGMSGQEIRQTKKIGEEPQNEEVGGAGPKGG